MKRAAFGVMSTLAGLVLLLGFKTAPLATTTAASTTAPSTAPAPATTGSGPPASTGSSTTSAAARTVTGHSVVTPYGDVQVRITVAGTKITDVTPVVLPSDDPRDEQINAAATPVLAREALSAQSADIQMVSGATYTSKGYVESLQSALDQVPATTDGQG